MWIFSFLKGSYAFLFFFIFLSSRSMYIVSQVYTKMICVVHTAQSLTDYTPHFSHIFMFYILEWPPWLKWINTIVNPRIQKLLLNCLILIDCLLGLGRQFWVLKLAVCSLKRSRTIFHDMTRLRAFEHWAFKVISDWMHNQRKKNILEIQWVQEVPVHLSSLILPENK